MNHLPLAHQTLAALFLAATLLPGCSDTVAPTPAVQLPAASASDTSGQATLVGTVPAAPTSETPASASADESDLTKAQESNAMPMTGQANDHSTTSPNATQKATTTP